MVAVKVYVVEHVIDAVLMLYALGGMAIFSSALAYVVGRRKLWFFIGSGVLSVVLVTLVNVLPVGMMFVMFCNGALLAIAMWSVSEVVWFALVERVREVEHEY